MQTLLKSTQKKCKKKTTEAMAKKGRKTISEYNAFSMHRSTGHVVKRIGKTLAGMSIKRGCQCSFMAKRLYINNSLCQLIYEHIEHANKSGNPCHGSMVADFRHAFDFNLSDEMKLHIEQMHAIRLSPVQIMSHHNEEVRDMAMNNQPVTRDTFLLPSDVRTYVVNEQKNCGRNIRRTPLVYVCGYMKIQLQFFTIKSMVFWI